MTQKAFKSKSLQLLLAFSILSLVSCNNPKTDIPSESIKESVVEEQPLFQSCLSFSWWHKATDLHCLPLYRPDDVVEALVSNDIPLFLIGIKTKNPNIHYIITDDYNGGKKVGEYFLKHAYRKCIYIIDSPLETSTRRLHGFYDEVKKDTNTKFYYVPFEMNKNAVEEAAKKIHEKKIQFAFCYSDYVALSLRIELKRKYNINDVMIFGFDNITEFLKIYEPINSVSTDIDNIVKEVVHDLNTCKKDSEAKITLGKIYPVKLAIYEE